MFNDFGYVKWIVGDRVFEDVNSLGVQASSDRSIAGAIVSLYESSDASGNALSSPILLGTTITDATGVYLFDLTDRVALHRLVPVPLGAALQAVVRSDQSVLDGLSLIAPSQGADATIDSDGQLIDSFGATSGESAVATLSNIQGGDDRRDELDFGYERIVALLTGRFFIDVNNDGVRNAGADDTQLGADAFSGVVVQLRNADTGDVLATTLVASDGTYRFELTELKITPDSVSLEVVADEDAQSDSFVGYYLSAKPNSVSGEPDRDSDAERAAGDGRIDVVPSSQITFDDSRESHFNEFGYVKWIVGDRVFEDLLGNGILSGDDRAIADVAVQLYQTSDGSGNALTQPILLGETTTNGGGVYLFDSTVSVALSAGVRVPLV